ncbi:MAG: cytochrome c [Gammaproteobacteria bacterium]|nr:cytochrome c [Gammaproteobacteria bacterium]
MQQLVFILWLISIGISGVWANPPDKAKGQALFTENCASCHGTDGNSTIPAQPKLAGQSAKYLVEQLEKFKKGERTSSIMQPFAMNLSLEDMQNIASWLSEKKMKPGFAKDKSLVGFGESLFRAGLVDRQIPACASCHGPSGAGIPPEFPRLAGQHAEYIKKQLESFRKGTRNDNLIMRQVADKLKDKEIDAVADYIAGLR